MATPQWQLIHAERDALAADLAGLTEAQWESPSLCQDWTVRQVVAHTTGAAMSTPVTFLMKFASAGFSFNAFTKKQLNLYLGSSAQETLANFRTAAPRTSAPPGPGAAWIGEAVIHAEDIRRPLGIKHTYNLEAVERTADFYVRSNAIVGAKKRIAGLRLEATDTPWGFGEGPVVRGPLLSLLMAMTGRTPFVDDLTGDGRAQLR